MLYLRAFIAGIVVPTLLLPLAILLWWGLGYLSLLTNPFFHLIPLLWGLWNVFYFAFLKNIFAANLDLRLLLTGALLGLLVALIGIFWARIPEHLGLSPPLAYFPLVVAPVAYALLWRYAVKPLNEILGLGYNQ